ncbi:MAG: glycosyltransferase family 4 protein [Candidatus Acidiferrales bacterium]
MAGATGKPRLAVVSPFVDKRHGTERRVTEWIARLADSYEIHIYSQDVQDLDLTKVTWHRISRIPGPHILNYLWWFAANRLRRAWDSRFRNLRPDLVYSPGINCLDADVMSVHIVFAQYVQSVQAGLRLSRNSILSWPRILHRRLYYRLLMALERRLYAPSGVPLVLIARRTAATLERFYGRRDRLPVVYVGLDHEIFNPARRAQLRDDARKELALPPDRFALLLVGNDGRNKGVPVIIRALASLCELPIDLLVVSREDPAPYLMSARDAGLEGRVRFLPQRGDIEFYYAAADAYVGPSLEDTFAQPPAEAMACGLPVIVSADNGTSEIITDGTDGLILHDATAADSLAAMIRMICEHPEFCARLGVKAAETARAYTWERNGRELAAIFADILREKTSPAAAALATESEPGGIAARK